MQTIFFIQHQQQRSNGQHSQQHQVDIVCPCLKISVPFIPLGIKHAALYDCIPLFLGHGVNKNRIFRSLEGTAYFFCPPLQVAVAVEFFPPDKITIFIHVTEFSGKIPAFHYRLNTF